jgi:hypothetical protein
MGGREGSLPRVTAEMLVQTNVGKSNVTMVSISGAGENLSQALADYAVHLRSTGKKQSLADKDNVEGR